MSTLVFILILAVNLPLARASFLALEGLKAVPRNQRLAAGFISTLLAALAARLYIESLPGPAGNDDWGHYFSACYGWVAMLVLAIGVASWLWSRRKKSFPAAITSCIALLCCAFLPAPYMSLYAQ